MMGKRKGIHTLEGMKQALSAMIGREPYEDIWLDMLDWTEGVIEDSPTPLEDVVAEYRKKEAIYYGNGKRRTGRRSPRVPREVPPDNRSKALAELLALRAGRLQEVERFRQDYLGGQLLALEDLPDWIEAQAKKDGKATTWLTIPLPEGIEPRDLNDVADALLAAARVFQQSRPQSMSVSIDTLDYLVPGDKWVHRVPIRAVGVLGELKRVAGLLSRRFTWREAHAVAFVLTGLIPPLPKAALSIRRASEGAALNRITLTVDPRLSPKEVADLYAPARAELFQSRDRPLSDKHLRLAIFTEEHAAAMPWKDMLEKWNDEYPEWSYNDRVNNFGRDAQSAWERLTEQPWPGKENIGRRPGRVDREADFKDLVTRMGGNADG